MTLQRLCSKTACGRAASCTLTYNYADSTIVLGPLAVHAEPHSYDLCGEHANRMTAPRGWDIVRLADEFPEAPAPDELVAIADAVRPQPAAQQPAPQQPADPAPVADPAARARRRAAIKETGADDAVSAVSVGRAAHLHVVPAAQPAQPADTQDAP